MEPSIWWPLGSNTPHTSGPEDWASKKYCLPAVWFPIQAVVFKLQRSAKCFEAGDQSLVNLMKQMGTYQQVDRRRQSDQYDR